ncbi:MAG: rod shape-determining protein MreC [Acidobacteria bacterium]|nr:MAG: rod shape-determining protein MreC [Acidobacteriota bacterium]
MQPRGSRPRKKFTFPVLVVFSLLLMMLPQSATSAGSTVVGEAVSPFQNMFASVARPVSGFFDGLINAGRYRSENDRLREELKQLRSESEGSAGAKRKVEELERMLKLHETDSIRGVPARVVASRQSNFDQAVIIDSGRDQGIEKGMPVVDPDGFVGVVEETSARSSKVRLLIDSRSGAGARLAESRDVGVVTGEGGGQLVLRLIDPRVPVRENEAIVTSGDAGGSVLPPDIMIGRVKSIEGAKSELEARIKIEPAVDFSRIEYVRVLIYTGPEAVGPK